ncbi:MAG: hypothetical protein ACRC2R_07300, partial [Xenococcaceae cyanobacterium]
AITFGQGDAGKVIINADEITFDGVGSNGVSSGAFSTVESTAIGNANDVEINTQQLFLNNGAVINSSTFGRGNAGNVKITAPNGNVSVDGVGSNNQSTSIFSSVATGAIGTGGNTSITAKSVKASNGGAIVASTFGQGDAGKVIINADEITFDGVGSNNFSSGVFSSVEPGGVGNGNNIQITTKKLSLSNSAIVGVDSRGEGNSGNLFIQADSINLDRNASISASTQFGVGGNITLQFTDILRLRNNSLISAQAFNNANGGNISINADGGFVVAYPNQNNDILASAPFGQGGKITIDAEQVFGFDRPRSGLNQTEIGELTNNNINDINASSGTPGLEGTVSIENLDVNRSSEVIQSSQDAIEPDETVASACSNNGSGEIANSFNVTGRGGLPQDPTKPLRGEMIRVSGGQESKGVEERRSGGAGEQESKGAEEVKTSDRKVSSDEIIPARGIAINEKGQIVLTRYPTPNGDLRTIPQVPGCLR